MNRFRKAWLALTGRLPVVAVPGKAMVRQVFRVHWLERRLGKGCVYTVRHHAYYESCADAHATGRQVTAMTVLRTDDGSYYLPSEELYEVEVQPKPKRPKGVRRGQG